jgi:DNA-binding response OmpR family regulator
MKKLLVIDENTSLVNAYQEMFKTKGVSVVGASTGKEGLAKVAAEKPNVILLDIMLPGGMNGFDVLGELKRNQATCEIPVIILTNLDTEEKIAKNMGAKNYLVKANTTKDEIVKCVMECIQN